MLNINHKIFENTVHSDNDILSLESLHLKFINEPRVYRPNPYPDYSYSNIPKREALKPSDFNDYERIKIFFYSELEKGRSRYGYKFDLLKRHRDFGVIHLLRQYNQRINYSLENNKPIVFHISNIKNDIKHLMIYTYDEIKFDIRCIRHYTGFYDKDALDLAPVRLEFACPFRNFIYLFNKKLLLNGKEW